MAVAAAPAAPRSIPGPPTTGKESSSRWTRLAGAGLPLVVLAAALTAAGCLYPSFCGMGRSLWSNPTHDRNAHYLTILKMATALQQGRGLALLETLNDARIWPPLHGLLGAAVVLVGGRDYRLAVLPSLAGWVGAVVFGFLAARRSVRRGGNLAGLVTALFLLASPAHRAFACDVMLESLGAGLTLAVLYCYLVARQAPPDRARAGRWLGIALTACFLEKYNYWLLVVIALLAAELVAQPRAVLARARSWLARTSWRTCLAGLGRQPLLVLAVATLLLALLVVLGGDHPYHWGGRQLSLYPPHNFVTIAYVLMFVPLARWWWRSGRQQIGRLDPLLAALVRWHLYFLAFWFLLPKHLSYFVWYLSPANAHGNQHFHLAGGVRDYAGWLVEDYHPTQASALAAGVLATIGLLCWRRLRPGGQAALLLFVLPLLLAVSHPNHKGRNLHSWMAAGWIASGIGAAALLYGRASWRPWMATAVLGGLAWMLAPTDLRLGHTLEGGPNPSRPSWLDPAEAILAELAPPHRGTVLTSVAIKPQLQWAFLERFGSLDGLEEHWWGFGDAGADNRRGFRSWLAATSCDTFVYLDRFPEYSWPDAGPETALHAELKDLLGQQDRFRLCATRDFPVLGFRLQVWRRAG